jgi:D-isomer specific 2-hydroxyacid dehydrogenase, catalytic domain
MTNSAPSNTILVISDSFHELPEAVALLRDSGHRVAYVKSLKKFQDITKAETPISVAEAEAIVMGRVMTVDKEALALAHKLRVIALHTSGSDNIDVAAATNRADSFNANHQPLRGIKTWSLTFNVLPLSHLPNLLHNAEGNFKQCYKCKNPVCQVCN